MIKVNLKTTAENNTATIAIDGRLDTMTSPELIAEIGKVAPANDKLILDVSRLEYISSAGVRALVTAHKQMAKKGGFTVKTLNIHDKESPTLHSFSKPCKVGLSLSWKQFFPA